MRKLISIGILILFSCVDNEKVFEISKPDGTMIKIIGEIEPVWSGSFFVYDSNENLSATGSILNGMADGIFQYYKDNKLTRTCMYKEDNLEGEMKWFYSNGKIEKITNYTDGKKNGESFMYDSLGTLIEYRYNSKYDKYTLFGLKYGVNLEYRGDPFIDIIPNKNYLSDLVYVEKGDTIILDLTIPSPPKCDFLLTVQKIRKGEKDVLDIVKVGNVSNQVIGVIYRLSC